MCARSCRALGSRSWGVETLLHDSRQLEKLTDSQNLRKRQQGGRCVYSQVLAGGIGSVYTQVLHALEHSKTHKCRHLFQHGRLWESENNQLWQNNAAVDHAEPPWTVSLSDGGSVILSLEAVLKWFEHFLWGVLKLLLLMWMTRPVDELATHDSQCCSVLQWQWLNEVRRSSFLIFWQALKVVFCSSRLWWDSIPFVELTF